MSARLSQYKTGAYGMGKKKSAATEAYTRRSLHNQAIITAKRPSGAPLSNRGFKGISTTTKERKYFDTPGQDWRVNTNGQFILLNVPVLGSDYNNRIGRKITSRSLYIRGTIRINAAIAVEGAPAVDVLCAAQEARMIVFVDSQPNGAQPIVADLLTEALPRGQLNPNNRDRFRILKDKLFQFDPFCYTHAVAGPPANPQQLFAGKTMYQMKIYKKLNIETIFNNGVAGTIGDINTNAIYVFFIGSHGPNVATETTAGITARIRFDDV